MDNLSISRYDKQLKGVSKAYNINWIKYLLGSEMYSQKVIPSSSLIHSLYVVKRPKYSDIEHLGSQAMSVTFGGESTCFLAAVCYSISMKKVASAKSFLMPEHLTPTDSATKFHRLRV